MILSRYFFIALLSALTLSQCTKSEQDIAGLPSGDLRNTLQSDTFTVHLKTVVADSFISSNSALITIGSYQDPMMGKVQAGHYTAVRLDKSNVQFASDLSNLRADSLVLQLPYYSSYPIYGTLGGGANAQTFEVFELTSKLEPTSYYYSNSSLSYNPIPVGTATVILNTTDSIFDPVTNTNLPPHVRIKLSGTLAQRFLEEGTPNHNGLFNNDNFINWFKGFYIRSNTPNQAVNTGAIAHFNPKSSLSTLSLYYTTLDNNQTKKFNFLLDANTPKFNVVQFDRSNTDAQQSILSTGNYTSAYIQSLGGTLAKIDFPYLQSWAKDKKIIIHYATLELGINNSSIPPFSAIERIYVLSKDASDKYITISDYISGGNYNYSSFNTSTNSYNLLLTKYLQETVGKYTSGAQTQATYKGLFLQPEFNAFLYRRSVIDASKTKLNLIYEVLPE